MKYVDRFKDFWPLLNHKASHYECFQMLVGAALSIKVEVLARHTHYVYYFLEEICT